MRMKTEKRNDLFIKPNINTSTRACLESVKGIGCATSAKILEERTFFLQILLILSHEFQEFLTQPNYLVILPQMLLLPLNIEK